MSSSYFNPVSWQDQQSVALRKTSTKIIVLKYEAGNRGVLPQLSLHRKSKHPGGVSFRFGSKKTMGNAPLAPADEADNYADGWPTNWTIVSVMM